MATATVSTERAQFGRDGFYVFRDVLDEGLVERLREASDASLAEQDEWHFAKQVATGSMIMVDGPFIERYPVFAEFIAYPPILKRQFDELGAYRRTFDALRDALDDRQDGRAARSGPRSRLRGCPGRAP